MPSNKHANHEVVQLFTVPSVSAASRSKQPLAERSLVCIGESAIPESLIQDLGVFGWNTIHADDIDEALAVLKTHECLVGLIHFQPGQDLVNTSELNQLMLNRSVLWVALIPDELKGDNNLWRMVSQYFYDYHMLPADASRLATVLGHAHGMMELVQRLHEQEKDTTALDDMIGVSASMQKLRRKIEKIAAVDAPVLLTGESGVGKELVVRAIYNRCKRSNEAFEAVNCGALPPTLIQSELFGYERGAFSGAMKRKIGHFELANGGVIFLDEIGDFPADLQVTILRALENKVIRRVGGVKDISIDVRVIAATNTNLEQAVANGTFREDLYYRLNVIQLHVPSLRERVEDVVPLARFFLIRFISRENLPKKSFSKGALRALTKYAWPGNVRELINRVEQAVVLCDGKLIQPGDLGLDGIICQTKRQTLEQARASAEKEAIKNALRCADGNVSEAARSLDISRATIYRAVEKYAIEE